MARRSIFFPSRVVPILKRSYFLEKANKSRCYKTCSMLNSAEHVNLNATKYKNIKKLSSFQAQISLDAIFHAHKLLAF